MFWSHHVFIPLARFVEPSGDMSLVNTIENGDRESLLAWTNDSMIRWLACEARHQWSWIVVNRDEDYNEIMDAIHGENWPEWRDYYDNRLVRLSFESIDDALIFKLTLL